MYIAGLCEKMRLGTASSCDVSEIYSRPRIAAEAPQYGLGQGFSLDIRTTDEETGEPWDFSRACCRAKAREKVEQERPYMLIGSPPCSPFSKLQAISRHKRRPEDYERMVVEGLVHHRFVFELYEIQRSQGRHFLHETPDKTWSLKCDFVQDMLERPGVHYASADGCMYGMTSGRAGRGTRQEADCMDYELRVRRRGDEHEV